MQYSEQERATFRQAFTLRRRRQLGITIPLAFFLVVLASTVDGEGLVPQFSRLPGSFRVALYLVLVGGAIAFSLYNWRCPACNRYLGKGTNPQFCPKCGAPLQ